MIAYFLGGCAIYGIVLFVLVMLRPKSALHTKKLTDCGRREKITIGVVLVILILLCTLPMGLAPGWNGEDPGATNQYELVAEAILNGHINIDNGDVDPLLLQMDNPYDPQARVDLGVDYRWDTAYYHGHYYMYFGVVPVFLLFLPVPSDYRNEPYDLPCDAGLCRVLYLRRLCEFLYDVKAVF